MNDTIFFEKSNELQIKILLLEIYDDVEKELKKYRNDDNKYAFNYANNIDKGLELIKKIKLFYFLVKDTTRFKFLNKEINGFYKGDEIPAYRNITMYKEKEDQTPSIQKNNIELKYIIVLSIFSEEIPPENEMVYDEWTEVCATIYKKILENELPHIADYVEKYLTE